MLLQHVKQNDLHEISEKLRILVEHSLMPYEDKFISVTLSIGATLFRDDTAETMLQRADQLLYQSKANGRNRVTIEHSPARKEGVMRNLLVTGGAGFIGSNFIHFMLQNDPGVPLSTWMR